jgi:hypothetical protein
MDGCLEERMNDWLDGWLVGCLFGWMNGRSLLDEWMDG